jgi:hypothetical protein
MLRLREGNGRTLHQHSHRLRLLDILDKGVLFLAQSVLVNETSVTEHIGSEVFDRVLRDTAACELETAWSV